MRQGDAYTVPITLFYIEISYKYKAVSLLIVYMSVQLTMTTNCAAY